MLVGFLNIAFLLGPLQTGRANMQSELEDRWLMDGGIAQIPLVPRILMKKGHAGRSA
jgi:hypothetical protein